MYTNEFERFTDETKIIINSNKTKVMKFNRSSKHDFPLEVGFSNNMLLEKNESIKLLGVIISDSFKWDENTDCICREA